MQEGWPANSTFAKGGAVNDEMGREEFGSQDIGVRKEVDVVGTKWHSDDSVDLKDLSQA